MPSTVPPELVFRWSMSSTTPRHALQLALFQLADFPLVAEVLVIAREEEQHVAGGVQPHPFEQFRPRRPDALEELHGRGQQLSGSRRCGRVGSHAAILAEERGGGRRPQRTRRTQRMLGGRYKTVTHYCSAPSQEGH